MSGTCLSPRSERSFCPLRFNSTGFEAEETLKDRLDPSVLAPGPTLYESLGVPCVVAQPGRLAGTFSAVATRGASVIGFRHLGAGVRALADAFARQEYRYGLLYWDLIDRAGHDHGPGSPEFAAGCRRSLDEVWDAVSELRGETVLITADHGQVDVSPERVDYLDDLWPQLPAFLTHSRPAGSSRDVFLHVHSEHVTTVIAELSARLDGRAEVRPAAELFDAIGPRLRDRLGDVAVLPSAGRQAWLAELPRASNVPRRRRLRRGRNLHVPRPAHEIVHAIRASAPLKFPGRQSVVEVKRQRSESRFEPVTSAAIRGRCDLPSERTASSS